MRVIGRPLTMGASRNGRMPEIENLGGTHGDESSNRAAPVNTVDPAPAAACKRSVTASDRAIAKDVRKTGARASAPKRKTPFVL
jgi:hypothetical protein